jgi:DNA-3-methyladenine glycosylase II
MQKMRLSLSGPFDLALTLKAASSFFFGPPESQAIMRQPIRLNGKPALIEVRQAYMRPAELEVALLGPGDRERVKEIAQWILLTDFNLLPFYEMVADDAVLGPVIKHLHGLKLMRPAELFEMMVIAITEQQISMVAAQRIRSRLVERFGEQVDGYWLFPTPENLARAPLEELNACGLSTRKSEYILGLATKVTAGTLDLEALRRLPDDEVRSTICGLRGFGRWSADYVLIRGLGRPDVVPADDLGIRTFTGIFLGNGSRMTAGEVMRAFEPYAPFRGIAMFYLMVNHRFSKIHK